MNPDANDSASKRSTELEARFAWLERHVTEQDRVMLELGDDIRRLRREVQELRKRLENAPEEKADGEPESRPPHY